MGKALSTFLLESELWWLGALGLAAFLALFWVLRGAPVGQSVGPEEDVEAPRGGYRDRVIAAICAGMLLILAGAYLAATRGPAWSLPAFVLGFGTVLALVAVNQRFRHGSPTMRRTVDVSTAALNASLFAGILIVVNVIAFRYGGRALDLTKEHAFSLSSLSAAEVKGLARPVTFTTFFGRSALAAQQYDRVRELLELYKTANPEKVKLDHIDPYRDLPRYDELVKRVPDVDVTQGGGVVIEYGPPETAERVVIRNLDLFDFPRERYNPSVQNFESNFKGEDAITSALMRLREAKKPKIVFIHGHGEPSIDEMGTTARRPGLGRWRSRLTATGSEVVSVNLVTDEIPANAALVVIASPKTLIKPEEIARLKAYTDKKGPLLLVIGDTQATGLEEFLKEFNIAVEKGFVVDPRLHYMRKDAVYVPITASQHPILEPLVDQMALFVRASPLTVLPAAHPGAPGSDLVTAPLLRTSPQSWVEPDPLTTTVQKDPGDTPGPVTVGVAVNDRPAQGETRLGAPRLLVYSSGYLGDNVTIQINAYNLDLLMNSVNWLRGRPELQGIAPKTHVSMTLTADPAIRARLILVPTVMAVLLIVTFGVATYLARRD